MLPNIVLVGPMGVGKSTIGRMLSERLGWSFVDTDRRIAKEAGASIPSIFEREGEAGFRSREQAAVRLACLGSRQVIAVGGGACMDPDNLASMQAAGLIVVLTAEPEVLWQRASGTARPLACDRDGFLRLHAERAPVFARLGLAVATDEGPPLVAVEAILSKVKGEGLLLPVRLGDRAYAIALEPGVLWHLGARMAEILAPGTCLVVTNPTIAALYGAAAMRALETAGWRPSLVTVPDSEEAKCLEQAERLYDHACAIRLERTQPIVALGGGVVGDLAGFVAATYQRGVPFVQVPTTLLAQIDSSVGGKVAINHPRGKNLIGAFHQPALVMADPLTLHSLPEREWRAGLAELVKYGVILDAALFEHLEAEWPQLCERRLSALLPAIRRACELKARIVEEDERELGVRAVLNFGHTLGHAIEAVTQYRMFLHGEAVAIGMVAAGEISLALGMWSSDAHARMVAWLERAGLPTRIPGLGRSALLSALAHDKKVQLGRSRFVLPEAIGRVVVRSDVPDAVLDSVLTKLGALSP